MNMELEAATALRRIALNEEIKAHVLQRLPRYQALLRAAMRFVGGKTLAQCKQVAKSPHEQGFRHHHRLHGESTRNPAMAEQGTLARAERVLSDDLLWS